VEAADVVREIGRETARHRHLVRRLGGEAVGAWEIVDDDGRREVLKFSPEPGWARHFARVGTVCAYLEARGYRASRVTESALLPSGVAYYVQEFVSGRPLAEQRAGVRMSPAAVDAMVDLNKLQEGLAPPVRQGWAGYIEDCMFGEDHEWRVLTALGDSAVDEVLAAARAFVGPRRGPVFSRDDLVTGSFEPHNVLVDGEILTVVDLDAAGTGDRMIDLAALLRFDVDGTHRDRIVAEAERVGRVRELLVASMYWSLSSLHLTLMAGEDPVRATNQTAEHLARLVAI
jgi:aminoglycoside phosphotransferase (APT) family kinase protein